MIWGVSSCVDGWITRWWVMAENGGFNVVIMEFMVYDVR